MKVTSVLRSRTSETCVGLHQKHSVEVSHVAPLSYRSLKAAGPGLGGGADTSALLPVIGFKRVFCFDRWLVETKWHFEGGVTPSLTLDLLTLFPQRNSPATLQTTLQFTRARAGRVEKRSPC